jgi:hypothetical protein
MRVTGTDDGPLTVYKLLKDNDRSTYQDWDWTQFLPSVGLPGDWVEIAKGLHPQICSIGFHGWLTLQKAKDEAVNNYTRFSIYEMELEGEVKRDHQKACGRRARLIRKLWDQNGEVVQLADLVWQ